jgi:hypothetical protein
MTTTGGERPFSIKWNMNGTVSPHRDCAPISASFRVFQKNRRNDFCSSMTMRFTRKGEGSLEEWIDGPYIHASVTSKLRLPIATCSDPATDGITWRLWELCLSLFTTFRPLIIDSTPNIDASAIAHWKDLLGTLFVWGDGFRNGQLDLILQDSDDLQITTLADLSAIASILNNSMSVRLTKPLCTRNT